MEQIKGIKTINVVRRDSQKEELLAIGADHVINSETEDIISRIQEITVCSTRSLSPVSKLESAPLLLCTFDALAHHQAGSRRQACC